MKEEVLHYLWKTKRLPFHQFVLTDGRKFEIIHPGTHNLESGPDFSNAQIKIDDLIWSGNIEIHVKSSDWYLHKHQLDKAYNNVILHVVYDEDKEVLINNERIPTIELSNYISLPEISKFQKLIKSTKNIACENFIQKIDNVYIFKQIETALIQRLNRKATLINERYTAVGSDLKQVIIEWTAKTVGGKTNDIPMIELSKRIELNKILRENEVDIVLILFILSGFVREDVGNDIKHLINKFQLKPMNRESWKFFGMRAPSYPPNRIFQFSQLIREDAFFRFFSTDIHEWLKWWNDWQVDSSKFQNVNEQLYYGQTIKYFKVTQRMKNLIVINVIVPFLYWYGQHRNDNQKIELAIEILTRLPLEENKVITQWKKLHVNVKSAFESQGLLELKDEFCNYKKCLSCHIGTKILHHENNTKDCFVL